jgi:DNA-binding transcriptional regulator LsrR (DeoR family)
MRRREEIQLMLQAARMYYQDDLSQQEVAHHLGLSRQKVSRLLKEARALGIVHIRLSDPFAANPELEQRLKQTFGLRQVVLTPGDGLTAGALRQRLGVAAAAYLTQAMPDEALVGIGWGRTLHQVVSALEKERQAYIHTVPLIGGIGQLSPSFQVNDLARRLAEAFGGTWRALYAPAFTDDLEAWQTLVRLAEVQQVARLWPQLHLAIVGIGHFEVQHLAAMFFADSLSQQALARFEAAGAVGDICGRFFDAHGRPIDGGSGVLGISLEQLRPLQNVVGIAGGAEKTAAVLGAIRGGYLGTLITDTLTAQAVLALHNAGTEDPKGLRDL